MRVFQIKTKSKSPRNKTNNMTTFSITKNKTSSSNNSKRGKKSNNSKNKNIFKKIFPNNPNKYQYRFSSNDCSQINTTNFNNSKTNNFIFFESAMNYKDNELFKQIKSLIKHNSSNNFSNIKFINSNNSINKKGIKNKVNTKKEELDNKRNVSDKVSLNKTNKLSISTNFSLLMKNKSKDKIDKIPKLKSIKSDFLHPLTLNFSNEVNNINSFRKLITNKSTKFFNKYKLSNDLLKRHSEKRAKSTERKKNKLNTTNKRVNNKILINNKKILKNSKSYNGIINSYIKSLSKSSSFSPKRKKEENKLDKKNENKISHKKIASMKKSNDANNINLQFFKSKNNDGNKLIKNRISPQSSKMIDMKLYARKFSYKKLEKIETKNNNTFMKDCKRIIKSQKVRIVTPEENHFLAISNIQKIKNNGKNFN